MSDQLCGFLGCTNTTRGEWAWQMCDPCYFDACDVDDSELS